MKLRIAVLFLLLLNVVCVFAQSDSSTTKVKERYIGFNMTGLGAQFIPFNAIDPFKTGPITVATKSFFGNTAYRFGIGVNLNGTDENVYLNIRNGIEHRKKINENWIYSYGTDFLLCLGNLNMPGNTSDQDNVMVGVAPFWSIEYRINKHVSLSTETSFLMALSANDFLRVQIIPPIALFLNIKR